MQVYADGTPYNWKDEKRKGEPFYIIDPDISHYFWHVPIVEFGPVIRPPFPSNPGETARYSDKENV